MEKYDVKPLIINTSNNVSTSNNQFQVNLPTTWYAQDAEVALSNMLIYFSWFNITSTFWNNSCSYVWVDGTSNVVAFPDGYYTPSDISGYIQYVMQQNGHYLVDSTGTNVYYLAVAENPVYYADVIESNPVPLGSLPTGYTNPNSVPLNGKCPQLVFSANNFFYQVLGFAAGASYPPTLAVGPAYSINSIVTPEVSPVNAVNVICNVANTGGFNNQSGIIYTFNSGNTAFGAQINIEPSFPIFYKVNDGRIPTISITLLDNNNNPLGVNDTAASCTLLFRQPKK